MRSHASTATPCGECRLADVAGPPSPAKRPAPEAALLQPSPARTDTAPVAKTTEWITWHAVEATSSCAGPTRGAYRATDCGRHEVRDARVLMRPAAETTRMRLFSVSAM